MPESAKSQSGGNLKYILGGVLLLGGAAAVFLVLSSPSAPPPAPTAPPQVPPPANVERVNPMAQPDLILDEQKDAGAPQQEAPAKPKVAQREVRDEWDCDGDLARPALMSVIDNNRSQVRNCYERRLKVNNVLQGDLTLKIKVGVNGQIAAASVGGSLKDNEVFGCVRSLAQKWTFPPPTGGCAVVQVPFQFSPKAN